IQKWDGHRPAINYLLAGFSRYIINEKYIELKREQKSKQKLSVPEDQSNRIGWIERLLQTPLSDYRKYSIWRILSPYLLNIRKLPEEEVTDIIRDWLNRCNQLRRLDFNYKQKIKDGIDGAKRGYLPISLAKLKEENSGLYLMLQDRD
ncbi:MAG: DNA primase noncatalytic subunit PriX, partial [Thermoproteota archaeon]|nr:DNA primase noncatalytic subunit PriX [Thermoproteota archaeon]